MEQPTHPTGESNTPETYQKNIMSIVAQLQALESNLDKLKRDQENLRDMPERAEKGSLLSEIESNIRNTLDQIKELQVKKMELVKEGDKKFLLEDLDAPASHDITPGSTEEQDPFRSAPDSTPGWRALNKK